MKKGGMIAMEERKNLAQWIKEHKKGLIIAGTGVGVLVLLALGIKNKTEIEALWIALGKTAKKSPEMLAEASVAMIETQAVPTMEGIDAIAPILNPNPFEVRRHIRNLPKGQHASAEKIAEAIEEGIILLDGQTLIDNYTKRGAAA